MGWLKNMTIKTNTKRILKELIMVLNNFMQENPNMSLETILQSPDFHNRLIIRDLKGKEIGRAGNIIQEFPANLQKNLFTLLSHVVWSILRYELKYDPTIGTEKDVRTVLNIVKGGLEDIVS